MPRYDTVRTLACSDRFGSRPPVTAEEMAQLTGRTMVGPSEAHDYQDPVTGRLYRLDNCRAESRVDVETAMRLARVILEGLWKFNGHPLVFDRDGVLVDGCVRAVALFLAQEILDLADEPNRWARNFPGGVVAIETLVVAGVPQAEALSERRHLSVWEILANDPITGPHLAACEYALETAGSELKDVVKALWRRTGRWRPVRDGAATPCEVIEYVRRHPHVGRALAEVHRIDRETNRGLSGRERFFRRRDAAVFLYLAGCSMSDPSVYRQALLTGEESEDLLDWSAWNDAVAHLTRLAEGNPQSEILWTVRRVDDAGEDHGTVINAGTDRERLALVCRHWSVTRLVTVPVEGLLDLEYTRQRSRIVLARMPTVGGIDLGDAELEMTAPQKIDLGDVAGEIRKIVPKHRRKRQTLVKIPETADVKLREGCDEWQAVRRVRRTMVDAILFFEADGGLSLYDADALIVARELGVKADMDGKRDFLRLSREDGLRAASILRMRFEVRLCVRTGWVVQCGPVPEVDG